MQVILIIIGSLLLLGIIWFLFGLIGQGDIKKMVIHEVDLAKVPDGVYKGKFSKVRWNYAVEVTVKDHRIVSIIRTNRSKYPELRVEDKATSSIIEKQSVKIDAVSGATLNTRAFQKAVEHALTGGKEPK